MSIPGEIRKLPKSSSPLWTDQWSYQGSAKAPYIVSRKQGYKSNGYATEQQKAQEWQCSCKSWTTTVPRQKCKHIVAVMLKEKISVGDHVVISKDEHEEYKKFLAARGTRKAGNLVDEEGRRFRP